MRTAISISCIVSYCVLYSLYLWLLTHNSNIAIHSLKLLYIYNTAGMIVAYLIDRRYITDNPYHQQINKMMIYAVIMNFAIQAIYFHRILQRAEPMMYLFNGSVIAVSLILLKCGSQHGYFKNTHEND